MTEKKTPPRENLSRSVSFTFTRDAGENGDGLTFEGYGAVFNSPTRIDSWEGTFDEQIAPGAFRKSLRERTPKFQFDHGHHPLIGSIPIGAISDIHEDDRGLYVQARLGQHIIIDLIREAIASGAIDGMSFRFSVVRDEWQDRDGKLVKPEEVDQILYRDPDDRGPLLRTLKEVKIAEVGPVVWPAYADTSAAVRSADVVEIDRTRLQEPEQRRLLADLLLRADAVDHAPERGESDEEPQDTTANDGVAVEHSDDDTAPPQPTEQAGEHEPEPETEQEDSTPPEDRSADDELFTTALAEVRNARELNPPMKGL